MPKKQRRIYIGKRIKSGLAVTPKHLELCDENLGLARVRSRNQFVEQAIEYYVSYLTAREHNNHFNPLPTNEIETGLERISKSLGTGQYKLSVELAKLCHLIAEQCSVTEYELEELHQKCAQEVKDLNSAPTFQNIYNQKP